MMRRASRIALLLAAWPALWCCAPAATAQEPRVVSVLSRDTLPYRDAEAAMREALARQSIATRSVVLNAAGTLPPAQMPAATAAVVTFGQRAGALFAAPRQAAQVSCMTLDPMGPASVVLPHPPEARLERVRRVFPRGATMGVLVSAEGKNEARIRDFQRAARRAGMETLLQPVDIRRPLGPQLELLADRIDVLVATYDLRIFSAANAQPMLLFSYRHRIPIIGVSDAWSRAGALMSFDWDYSDVGRQCGELAAGMLAGRVAERIVEAPRRLVYSVNLEAARHFLIQLPADFVEGARHRFN